MIQPLSSTKSQKKEKIIRWIRNCVDYSREREGKPYTFYRDASFYDCLLPSMADVQPNLRNLYVRSVVDEDMKSDLEDSHSINWSSQAVELLPVCVPKDGNCLLHAASMAVWGVEDSQNTLRDLMLMTVKNNHNFKKRWWSQLMRNLQSLEISQPEVIDHEWDDVIRSISDLGSSSLSVAVPHRFLEGVHIYILANILRRPIIIVTNGPAKSLAGDELQENHIGGLYLPLEWPCIECCKTPIILGYSYSHFCPLISETRPHFLALQKQRERPLMFPLVHSDLSFLLVRYLREEEDPAAWDLVQSYLLVKEIDVVENAGTVTKAPFTQICITPLEPEQNTLFEHLAILKTRFMEANFLKDSRGQLYTTLGASQRRTHPFYDIEMNSQTEVVPLSTIKDKNIEEQQKRKSPSYKCIQEMNKNIPSKCIVEGCSKEGNLSLDNFCCDCFKIIAEATSPALFEGHSVLNQMINPAAPEDKKLSRITSEATFNSNEGQYVIPTAPLLSLEPQSQNYQLLSMMPERCINHCGYRCSTKTYPYCHSCFQSKKDLDQSNARASSPHEITEKEMIKTRLESKESLVEDTKGLQEPKECNINHMIKQVTLSPQSSTLSSFSYISTPTTNPEDSWLLEKGHISLSHLLIDTSDKLTKCPLEIMAGQNCRNYEHCSGQKMLDHYLCFSCAVDKEGLQIISKESQVEPKLPIALGKPDRAMFSHVEQMYEANSGESIEGFAESFAEAEIKNISGDIEVSEEPLCKVKCTSPYCENFVLSPEKLCDKCKDILKRGYEQSKECLNQSGQVTVSRVIEDQLEKEKLLQKEKIKPKLDLKRVESVSKGKPCIMVSCPNYGDPQMNNMCSSCHFKSILSVKSQGATETGKKRDAISYVSGRAANRHISQKEVSQHNESSHCTQQIYSTSPVHTKGSSGSRSAEVHLHKGPRHVDPPPPVYPYHYQPNETFGPESSISSQTSSSFSHPEPRSLIVTSKTGHNTNESLHQQAIKDVSYSFNQNAEKHFEKVFENIEKTWKSSAKKCISVKCENYGNKAMEGYCNACFKVIRRQRILEIETRRGVDVPDSDVLESA